MIGLLCHASSTEEREEIKDTVIDSLTHSNNARCSAQGQGRKYRGIENSLCARLVGYTRWVMMM